MDKKILYASDQAASPEIAVRQVIERTIVAKVVTDAIAAGYLLNVDNGGDTEELTSPTTDAELVMETLFATDEEHLLLTKDGKTKSVFFVYGNSGWDVINDYHCSIEPIVGPAELLAARIEKGHFTITLD